jgi:hypothetical protein
MMQLVDALSTLADALAIHLSEAENREIYTHIRTLEQQVSTTEQAYSLGVDSTRLNPWAHHARRLLVDYPDMLQTLGQLLRQMRRIAYTINEPEPSWSELVQNEDWVLDCAQLLKEIADILFAAAEYVCSPATTRSGDMLAKEALIAQVERTQRQFRNWHTQLAEDAKQISVRAENADNQFSDPGYRIAIRGTILTDLRRMLNEVQDIVEMAVHPSLS